MWYLLVLVPFVLLGFCSIAAAIVGGRAERPVKRQQAKTVHELPTPRAAAKPVFKALG